MEPIYEKIFIYDSCANRKRKGTSFAIKRFDLFKRKASKNGKLIKNKFNDNNYVQGYCLKADIKHYFKEIDHDILIKILKKKIKDKETMSLIHRIIKNFPNKEKGMPLGNLTSQFFANVYLNELDYFVKHKLNSKYYIRYVDDFILFNRSLMELKSNKEKVIIFLKIRLKLLLHSDKSNIIPLSRGVDFVGFRNFYYFKLLRKRNLIDIDLKIKLFNNRKINKFKFIEIFQGWNAYANLANSYNLRKKLILTINPNNL